MIMKKYIMLIFVLLFCFVGGCNNKSFTQPVLTRDNFNTGGNISFFYDKEAFIAYFGGEGDVVQFYNVDIAKGWDEDGCRVGVQLDLPKEIDDFKSATAKVDEKNLTSKDFIIEIDEQTQIAVFHPIVSEDKKHISIEITWAEGVEPQEYKIIIKEGTIFMEK